MGGLGQQTEWGRTSQNSPVLKGNPDEDGAGKLFSMRNWGGATAQRVHGHVGKRLQSKTERKGNPISARNKKESHKSGPKGGDDEKNS